MKKWAGILIAVLLILTQSAFIGASGENGGAQRTENTAEEKVPEEVPEGFMLIAENRVLSLWVDTSTADIMVEDKGASHRWYSNPINRMDDGAASRSMKEQLKSQLWVSFLDEIRNIVTVESYTNCVLKNTFEIRLVRENSRVTGFKTTYDFKETTQRFKIPLQVTLAENHIETKILYDEIEEYGTSVVCKIDLLPSFGAGRPEDDGYLFVPDGSGAVIKFKDSYREAPDYNETVYGRDPAVNLLLKSIPDSQSIRMPVFGIKNGRAAFLAVIGGGDALASIRASSNSRVSSYSTVSAAFVYRENDQAGIVNRDSLVRTVRMADKRPASASPSVRYYFLRDGDADYSGMARTYQSLLVQKYGLKRLDENDFSPLTLELFGLTEVKTNFLGIPVKKAVAATTFSQATDILSALRRSGVSDVSTVLYGFQKGGYQKKTVAGESFDSGLGGKKGFMRLLAEADAPVYVSYDMIRNYSAADSWLKGENFIRNLNGLTITRERGTLSSGSWNGSARWLITSAWLLEKNCARLLRKTTRAEHSGIAFQHMGEELYSNFSPKAGADRQQLMNTYERILESSAETLRHVAGESGNVYLLRGAELLYEVPLASSGFHIISRSVPFYSMVLHGYVRLSSENLGSSPDMQSMLLKCMEAGVSPTFRVTGCDAGRLSKTSFQFLYNTRFSDWSDTIAKSAKEYAQIQQSLSAQRITAHKYEGSLSVTAYENGVCVISNTGTSAQDYQGVTVAPKSVGMTVK